jgi:hypothetical protein
MFKNSKNDNIVSLFGAFLTINRHILDFSLKFISEI